MPSISDEPGYIIEIITATSEKTGFKEKTRIVLSSRHGATTHELLNVRFPGRVLYGNLDSPKIDLTWAENDVTLSFTHDYDDEVVETVELKMDLSGRSFALEIIES